MNTRSPGKIHPRAISLVSSTKNSTYKHHWFSNHKKEKIKTILAWFTATAKVQRYNALFHLLSLFSLNQFNVQTHTRDPSPSISATKSSSLIHHGNDKKRRNHFQQLLTKAIHQESIKRHLPLTIGWVLILTTFQGLSIESFKADDQFKPKEAKFKMTVRPI